VHCINDWVSGEGIGLQHRQGIRYRGFWLLQVISMSCMQLLGREPFYCTAPGYGLLNSGPYLTFLVNEFDSGGKENHYLGYYNGKWQNDSDKGL